MTCAKQVSALIAAARPEPPVEGALPVLHVDVGTPERGPAHDLAMRLADWYDDEWNFYEMADVLVTEAAARSGHDAPEA